MFNFDGDSVTVNIRLTGLPGQIWKMSQKEDTLGMMVFCGLELIKTGKIGRFME